MEEAEHLDAPAQAAPPEPQEEVGHIGKVPVRNLWLLLLYASQYYKHLRTGESGRRNLEERLDDLLDLIAEILCHSVERRVRRHLSYGYQPRRADLARVRGRIDILRTERRQMRQRGKIACRFDELTVDTPRNRFVRAALERLAAVLGTAEKAHDCRALALTLQSMGVQGGKPTRAQMSTDRFGLHDAADQEMVSLAQLAFDLSIPGESDGAKRMPLLDRDNQTQIRRLFEKGVAGLYDVQLRRHGWRVGPGERLHWLREGGSEGMQAILPTMQTDIVLEHPQESRRIVIDTKFNPVFGKGHHRDKTLRSQYIYQIYAYLRSQEERGGLHQSAEGWLLHPATGEAVDEWTRIQGHKMRLVTVDLTLSPREIRDQLLGLVDDPVPAGAALDSLGA